MPQPTLWNVRHSLKVARGLISGAAISLEHIISRNDVDRPAGDPITTELAMQISLEQQGDWIIGELEHAIAQIRNAQAVTAGLNTQAAVIPTTEPQAAQARAA